MILGGQFVSRINMNLREDKGYTYGARTSFDSVEGPALRAHASVQSDATVDAVIEALAECTRYAATSRRPRSSKPAAPL